MTGFETRTHCVCFTGHRPEKLSFSEAEVKAGLTEQIKKAVEDGYTTFITGMGKGVDLWAGEIVCKLRDNGSNIKLVAASPYDGFGKGWPAEWRSLHREILEKADFVENVCPGYHKGCFLVRDKWMVDHSDLVIAVFNGAPGGTKFTIDYAKKQGVKVSFVSNTPEATKTPEQPKQADMAVTPTEKVTGLHVIHAKFGPGVITEQTASTITVQFSDRAAKFEYPGAFTRKYLKLAES